MNTLAVWLLAASTAASPYHQKPVRPQPLVRVIPSDISVCPDDFPECHLTTVDNTLCTFLSELLDPLANSYKDNYNCDNREEGIYSCVNVLGRRKTDASVKTDYTYPYLIELAYNYERQLNRCLPRWRKSRFISEAGQSISYTFGKRVVILSIAPFEHGSVQYDRLTLTVRDPIRKR